MQKWIYTLALWVVTFGTGAANALPTGPLVSGNGQLEFSNFELFSPGGKVDEDDITVTVLADGISLSGPLSVTRGAVNFFVTYDVRALGAGIVTASLELDADPTGLVLSTKRIVGDRGDPCDWFGEHDEKGGWFDDHDRKGKGKDKDKGKGRHGFGRWDRGGKHDFDFDPFGRDPLAFLKTKQVGDRGIFLAAARFAPQDSLHVIEHVVVAAAKDATWNASINRFTVVPEPRTASLTLLGLALLALRSHRKR
jgi:hypothetical protein